MRGTVTKMNQPDASNDQYQCYLHGIVFTSCELIMATKLTSARTEVTHTGSYLVAGIESTVAMDI